MNAQQQAATRRFIFISFASADIDLAEWLADRLAVLGFVPWLDRHRLRGGDDWSCEIGRVMADETCRVSICCPAIRYATPTPPRSGREPATWGVSVARPF